MGFKEVRESCQILVKKREKLIDINSTTKKIYHGVNKFNEESLMVIVFVSKHPWKRRCGSYLFRLIWLFQVTFDFLRLLKGL
jgi:hypothetical protein